MPSPSGSTALPDYDHPPVVETVLGVQFDRLKGFTNAHLGAFWQSLDASEWPSVTDAPPLDPQFETFGGRGWAKHLRVQLTQDPASRLRITNASGTEMIQVQNTRLHFNWIRGTDGTYPRYDSIRDRFRQVFEQFKRFVDQSKVSGFQPNQWEVTYVNHIPRGTVWKSPRDWGFFRPLNSLATIDGVVHGESFNGEWHFVIPPERGRLHIGWQYGLDSVSKDAPSEMIRLTLTARGAIPSANGSADSVLAGLDLGRETIVRAFVSLMTDRANKSWGLKNA